MSDPDAQSDGELSEEGAIAEEPQAPAPIDAAENTGEAEEAPAAENAAEAEASTADADVADEQPAADDNGEEAAEEPSSDAAAEPAAADDTDTDALLDRWEAAKKARDYKTSDELRAQLREFGIEPDHVRPIGKAAQSAQAAAAAAEQRFSPEIEAKLKEWVDAKRTKDFETADRLREELRAGDPSIPTWSGRAPAPTLAARIRSRRGTTPRRMRSSTNGSTRSAARTFPWRISSARSYGQRVSTRTPRGPQEGRRAAIRVRRRLGMATALHQAMARHRAAPAMAMVTVRRHRVMDTDRLHQGPTLIGCSRNGRAQSARGIM